MIYQDCLAGVFDDSLQRYQSWLKGEAPVAQADLTAMAAASQPQPSATSPAGSTKRAQTTSVSLEKLLIQRIERNRTAVDEGLLGILRVFGPVRNQKEARSFLRWMEQERGLAPSSIDRYLDVLKVVKRDWFMDIKIRVPEKPIRPFSTDEVQKILAAFKRSRYYRHYYDFVVAMFETGCRPSELIGLRWRDVDFKGQRLAVFESLGRHEGKSHIRKRKPTKTCQGRYVPLSSTLEAMLNNKKGQQTNADALVFTAPKGGPLRDHDFNRRAWHRCLEDAGVEYRPPYNSRHTFISHALGVGVNPIELSSIAGHNVRTMFEKYVGLVRRPEIPDLYGTQPHLEGVPSESITGNVFQSD
uniref:Integrase family protein n=1 Tax=Cyanothece sp. (strain PCC 7425 / ATCC 29141) TaxID=395961 RepID=B8HWH2_CYAP4